MSELVERFRRLYRDTPDRALLHLPHEAGTTHTVADVWNASLELRGALERLGLSQDSLAMLAIGNRGAAFPFWLASRAARVAVMPVDSGVTPVEMAELAQRFGATALIVPETTAFPDTIATTSAPFVEGLKAVRFPGVEPRPDLYRGAAALKLTSGSTGLPKATFTTEAQLIVDTEHIVEAMDIRPEHTQLAAIPLSHAYGLGNLLMAALLQGTAVVVREGFVPHAFLRDARHWGVHVFPGVPFMFEHLMSTPRPGGWPPQLRKLVSAGARLEANTVRRFHDAFGIKIHSFYGTSETGGITYDDGDEVREETSVGREMPGVRVELRAEEGAPQGSGRVHVSGAAVASQYVGERPADGAFSDGGFLTGDFGRFDASRHLILTGRVSLFINVAGRKVQPEEVEQVIREMPSVADVRVLGAADEARGQQVVACVVPASAGLSTFAVRQYCAARLAAYKLPRAVVLLDRVPLTERGKTDRVRLEAIVSAHLASSASPDVL